MRSVDHLRNSVDDAELVLLTWGCLHPACPANIRHHWDISVPLIEIYCTYHITRRSGIFQFFNRGSRSKINFYHVYADFHPGSGCAHNRSYYLCCAERECRHVVSNVL